MSTNPNPSDENKKVDSIDKSIATTDKKIEETKLEVATDFLPGAEYYEAEAQNLELNIKARKAEILVDLQDDLLRLQYELNQKEAELRIKELLLNRREKELIEREQELREAQLQLRNAQLVAQQEFEERQSPKELALEESLDEENEGNLPIRPIGVSKEGQIHNPEGKGGPVGSSKNQSIVINQGVYQGDFIPLEDGSSLLWDSSTEQYNLQSENQGLVGTFFAVEATYLKDKDGYDNPNYPNLYSQTVLRQQVWYERPLARRHGHNDDGLGVQYRGRVPFDVLVNKLNGQVNTRRFNPNGQYDENQDFRNAYKNWRYRYETGVYFKTRDGAPYFIADKGTTRDESQGNPPAYRTDGHFNSPNYGQRKPTSDEEKARWKGFGNNKGKKDLFKKRK